MVVEQFILEAAKIGLQLFFINMKLAGKTDEEVKQIYDNEKELFLLNKPEDLPDV